MKKVVFQKEHKLNNDTFKKGDVVKVSDNLRNVLVEELVAKDYKAPKKGK
jgi:hypothetical protein